MNVFINSTTQNQASKSLSDRVKEEGPISSRRVYGYLRSLRVGLANTEPRVRCRIGPKSLVVDRRQRLRINPRKLYSKKAGQCWWLNESDTLSPSALETRHFGCLTYWMLTGKQPFLKQKLLDRNALKANLLSVTTTATMEMVMLGLLAPQERTAREFVHDFGRSLLKIGDYQIENTEQFLAGQIHYLSRSSSGEDVTILKYRETKEAKVPDRNIGRFYLHAKLAMQVPSRIVPTAYEVAADGTVHYCIQERVNGRYLLDLIQSDGPLRPSTALGIAAQVADRLADLHQQGILLRNIQPANLFLSDGGDVLFTWLGDSRLPELNIDLVDENRAVGNRFYSAPEVMTDAPSADETSDLFSLAAVLYFLMFGTSPFDSIPKDLLYRHKMHREPWRAHLIQARCPEPVIGLMDRVLCRRDHRQIRTATHFATVCRRIQKRLESPSPSRSAK